MIQRNEETAEPIFFKDWLPEDIAQRYAFVLDPMLATGGSAIATMKLLKERGVEENKIIFITLVSAPEGIEAVLNAFPNIRIITAEVDQGLNERAYIVPGLGRFWRYLFRNGLRRRRK